MNYLDLIIVVFIIAFAIGGFKNGLIKELTSLLALILGIWFAVYFSDVVAGLLMRHFDIGHKYVFIIAFILTFVGVAVMVHLIGNMLDKIASLAAAGLINKIFGSVFGVLKGIFFLSIFILIFNMFDPKEKILHGDTKKGSWLYLPISTVAPAILNNLLNFDFSDPEWLEKNKGDKTRLDKMV